jgi:DNA-binding CsgD family transcriptional regulator
LVDASEPAQVSAIPRHILAPDGIPTLTDAVELGGKRASGDEPVVPGYDLSLLTKREAEILRRLAVGYRIGEIAIDLHRSPKTIETHKKRAKQKLGITTSIEWMNLLRSLPGAKA